MQRFELRASVRRIHFLGGAFVGVSPRLPLAKTVSSSIQFDAIFFARLIQALGEQVVLQRLPGENCHKL